MDVPGVAWDRPERNQGLGVLQDHEEESKLLAAPSTFVGH